jgi:hypothetical protein
LKSFFSSPLVHSSDFDFLSLLLPPRHTVLKERERKLKGKGCGRHKKGFFFIYYAQASRSHKAFMCVHIHMYAKHSSHYEQAAAATRAETHIGKLTGNEMCNKKCFYKLFLFTIEGKRTDTERARKKEKFACLKDRESDKFETIKP